MMLGVAVGRPRVHSAASPRAQRRTCARRPRRQHHLRGGKRHRRAIRRERSAPRTRVARDLSATVPRDHALLPALFFSTRCRLDAGSLLCVLLCSRAAGVLCRHPRAGGRRCAARRRECLRAQTARDPWRPRAAHCCHVRRKARQSGRVRRACAASACGKRVRRARASLAVSAVARASTASALPCLPAHRPVQAASVANTPRAMARTAIPHKMHLLV